MKIKKRDFDKEAASWDEHPARVKLAKDIADAISKQIVLTSDMNAVDFGCGTGLLTIQLQPLVHSIIGIDSSQGMLDIFNTKIAKLKLPNVRSLLVDLDKGDSLAGKYHLIVSNLTLHHIKEIIPLFDQFYTIMAPAGYLCIADLDLDDGQFHDNNTGVFHFGFDRATLRKSFTGAGFDNVQDMTAAEVVKPTLNGEMRQFTVFLMTGQKRSE
ncbi:MAG: class I SAM-dependent methyltransferase [Deltaproteobacteria bacterium]|nr:class I SAM-dependent methyltransferase [Deltaproteobacteria bacterium]